MSLPLPSAVVWDMDGTLIDQTASILRCYVEVIKRMGQPAPDNKEIHRSMGGPMAETMARFVKPQQLEEACATFRTRFPQIMFEGLIILPGAADLIAFFAQNNIPQAILTNKHGATARAVSTHCGFANQIHLCIGNTDTQWSKPDVNLTRHVFAQMNAEPEGAALVGDSPTDGETARNAGINFYGVSTGAHSQAELAEAGAAYTCADLRDLLEQFSR